jgi:hypothetical protein
MDLPRPFGTFSNFSPCFRESRMLSRSYVHVKQLPKACLLTISASLLSSRLSCTLRFYISKNLFDPLTER